MVLLGGLESCRYDLLLAVIGIVLVVAAQEQVLQQEVELHHRSPHPTMQVHTILLQQLVVGGQTTRRLLTLILILALLAFVELHASPTPQLIMDELLDDLTALHDLFLVH